jgi:cytochrome c-type biogenesis protein CcmH
MKAILFSLLLGLAASPLAVTAADAQEAPINADDPVIEQRLIGIADELRCLVCQNESLAASKAELAEDLRREIRSQMKAGKNDAEVIDYLTDRYGDFVLYRPPFKPVTYLLWLGPVIFLAIGVAAWLAAMRRRKSRAASTPDAAQLAAAAKLLEESERP